MHRDAQRQVYEFMAPKLYRTCKRYLKKEEEIEEAFAAVKRGEVLKCVLTF